MKTAKLNQLRTLLTSFRVSHDSRSAIHALPKRLGAVLLAWWFRRPAIGVFIALTAMVAVFLVVHAAARTWSNTGTDYNTGGNWSGAVAPGLGDVGQFASAAVAQPNLSASLSNAGLCFSTTASSGYDVTRTSGAVFTFTGQTTGSAAQSTNSTSAAIFAANSSGTNIIDVPLTLAPASGTTSTFNQASGLWLKIQQHRPC
jgi:hypothetical protein